MTTWGGALCVPNLSIPVVPYPAGARHPHGHGLRGGPAPLGGVPGARAALRGLEEGVAHPCDQHRGVPTPETCTVQTGLHPQWHHGTLHFHVHSNTTAGTPEGAALTGGLTSASILKIPQDPAAVRMPKECIC